MPGTPTYIIVASPAGAQQLQAWINSISGANVITEAVTLADSAGIEKLSLVNPGIVQDSIVIDLLGTLIKEVRALRRATVAMACDSGRAKEADFDPASLDTDVDPISLAS